MAIAATVNRGCWDGERNHIVGLAKAALGVNKVALDDLATRGIVVVDSKRGTYGFLPMSDEAAAEINERTEDELQRVKDSCLPQPPRWRASHPPCTMAHPLATVL